MFQVQARFLTMTDRNLIQSTLKVWFALEKLKSITRKCEVILGVLTLTYSFNQFTIREVILAEFPKSQ